MHPAIRCCGRAASSRSQSVPCSWLLVDPVNRRHPTRWAGASVDPGTQAVLNRFMSERDDYPAGVPCWVDTLQADVNAALDFYGQLFGWTFEGPGPLPGGLPGQYFVAQLRG